MTKKIENIAGPALQNMGEKSDSVGVIRCPPRHTASTDAEILLEALWRTPDLTHQVGTLDRLSKQFRNVPVSNVAQACQLALLQSQSGSDSYFACA